MMLFLLASVLTFTVSTICLQKIRTNESLVPVRFCKASASTLLNYSKWVCLTDLMSTGILFSGNLILSYHNLEDLARFNVVIMI